MYYNKLTGKLESELPNPLFHPDGRKTNNPTPDQHAKYYCIAIMPTTQEGMVIIGGSEQVHYDEETNSATVSYLYETLADKEARDQAEQTEREAKDAADYGAFIATIAPKAQLFAHTLREYFPDLDPPAEQNGAVTEAAVEAFFIGRKLAGDVTAKETLDALYLSKAFPSLAQYCGGNTWDLPWSAIWDVV